MPDQNGQTQQYDVIASVEFLRALSDVFERVGGPNGMSNDDLATLATYISPPDTSLQNTVDELRTQLDSVNALAAEVAGLRQRLSEVEQEASFNPEYRVNWERPGKIGSLTKNTGDFTQVTVVTINKVTITTPATAATLTLADNSTLATVGAFTSTFTMTGATGVTFPTTGTLATLAGAEALTNKSVNDVTLAGTAATLNVGVGGTLGSAAYTSSSAYVPAHAPVVADGTIAKIETALKGNGIMS